MSLLNAIELVTAIQVAPITIYGLIQARRVWREQRARARTHEENES